MAPKKTICFLLLLICIFACEQTEEPLEPEPQEPIVLEYGTVSGTITDAGTGNPIPGVVVTLQEKVALTGIDGVYSFQNVLYGDTHALVVEDMHYKPHNEIFALGQQRVVVSVALTPLKDPVQEIEEFFDHFADLLESVDMDNIKAIQDLFSETYAAADDDATVFGVASGIIPENFEDVDPAMMQLFMEYTFLEFLFKDVDMDVKHAKKAAVTLRLDVNARKELEEDLREIKANCKFEFRREGSDWKIVYWQLLAIDIRL